MAKIVFDFKPGDHVWLMSDGKAVCGIVTKLWYSQFISPVDFEEIKGNKLYYVQVGSHSAESHTGNELFKTKEDLIKSL